jgi:hypothetical protein
VDIVATASCDFGHYSRRCSKLLRGRSLYEIEISINQSKHSLRYCRPLNIRKLKSLLFYFPMCLLKINTSILIRTAFPIAWNQESNPEHTETRMENRSLVSSLRGRLPPCQKASITPFIYPHSVPHYPLDHSPKQNTTFPHSSFPYGNY